MIGWNRFPNGWGVKADRSLNGQKKKMTGLHYALMPHAFAVVLCKPESATTVSIKRKGKEREIKAHQSWALMGLSLRVLLVHGHPTRISHGRP